MKISRILRRSKALPSYYSADALKYVENIQSQWKNGEYLFNNSWTEYFELAQKGQTPLEIEPIIYKSVQSSSSSLDNVNIKAERLYQEFLKNSHFWAKTDPLNLPKKHPHYRELYTRVSRKPQLSDFELSPLDLTHTVNIKPFGQIKLSDLVAKLEASLCGCIGYEFFHASDDVIEFFQQEIFNPNQITLKDKLNYLNVITRASLFESYLKKTFPTIKRFGLEGLDSLVVALDVIKNGCLDNYIESMVLGMAHRGRLNVLCNIFQKPLDIFFAEFRGKNTFGKSDWGNTGDVKYHIGHEYSCQRGDHELKLALLSNPSHLEFVQPLVCGRARAKLDLGEKNVVPIVIHGDASMSGQGIVYETVQLGLLPNYSNKGTIHIVSNNQIGFTTYPVDGASSCYSTDVAKVVNAPVLHVNANDVEAVAFASNLALKFHQKFHTDIFIDIIGYRRMGHNELDMPKFTNPYLYQVIDKQAPVYQIYSSSLIDKGEVSEEAFEAIKSSISQEFDQALDRSKMVQELPENASCKVMKNWESVHKAPVAVPNYKYEIGYLKELVSALSTLPDDFEPHNSIKKIFNQRLECLNTGNGIDFGLAELLAYSVLVNDGFVVRLSGQDSQRGTFSHRHAIVHHQSNFSTFNVFTNITNGKMVNVYNSPLNEAAALGFEYGYGLENPKILPIWEAQFGDFVNVAQVMIDEFVASSETKWNQSSAITLLLPHGYDGQGPDHSSCRVERFLQLCDDDPFELLDVMDDIDVENVAKRRNMSVVNCSTAANLFHALLRQMHRSFRKPLILCSGKKLLKLRPASSSFEDFQGSFKRLISDDEAVAANVDEIIFCTGQVYYDLYARREQLGARNVALERIEQISPFPYDLVMSSLKKFGRANRVVWCQEEPMNSGCWSFVQPWFNNIFKKLDLQLSVQYVGPRILSAPSTGDMAQHERILEEFLSAAFPGTYPGK